MLIFALWILQAFSQYYHPHGYGPKIAYENNPRSLILKRARAVSDAVYASLEQTGNFRHAVAMGQMEMPTMQSMYEDAPYGFPPGSIAPHIDPNNPLAGGRNSIMNPAAFDDANFDDYIGADFEGFVTGWQSYKRRHPGAKGPPSIFGKGTGKGSGSAHSSRGKGRGMPRNPRMPQMMPPAPLPDFPSYQPYPTDMNMFMPPEQQYTQSSYPQDLFPQEAYSDFPRNPPPPPPPQDMPVAGDTGASPESPSAPAVNLPPGGTPNTPSPELSVSIVFRNSFCTENAVFLDRATDPFACAEMAAANKNCGVYFFMPMAGGDCTCVTSGQPCQVEQSDIHNSVFMVQSTTSEPNPGVV